MATAREVCSDCGGTAHEIKLVDYAHGNRPRDVEYTLPEAKRSIWTGRFPAEGRIVAYMCESCGRIAYFGAPQS